MGEFRILNSYLENDLGVKYNTRFIVQERRSFLGMKYWGKPWVWSNNGLKIHKCRVLPEFYTKIKAKNFLLELQSRDKIYTVLDKEVKRICYYYKSFKEYQCSYAVKVHGEIIESRYLDELEHEMKRYNINSKTDIISY